MKTYTIELNDTEDKAFSYVTVSQQFWIDNVVHERCRVAIEEIVQLTVQKCIATNTQIPNNIDDIVALAFTNNWIQTAAQKNASANTPG